MSHVVDASAILAFLQGEPGGDEVEAALIAGSVCGAANWSEVAQKVMGAGQDWDLIRALLIAYKIEVVPVDATDAEWAARHWRRNEGLSLGDRLCLALGARRAETVLTCDARWGTSEGIRQIR